MLFVGSLHALHVMRATLRHNARHSSERSNSRPRHAHAALDAHAPATISRPPTLEARQSSPTAAAMSAGSRERSALHPAGGGWRRPGAGRPCFSIRRGLHVQSRTAIVPSFGTGPSKTVRWTVINAVYVHWCAHGAHISPPNSLCGPDRCPSRRLARPSGVRQLRALHAF
jgi:hypothetical protein